MQEKKSDIVRKLVADREFKSALKIAKDFRIGISKSDSDAMKRGYECMVNPKFYAQIGFDPQKEIEKGIETITRIYGKDGRNTDDRTFQSSNR